MGKLTGYSEKIHTRDIGPFHILYFCNSIVWILPYLFWTCLPFHSLFPALVTSIRGGLITPIHAICPASKWYTTWGPERGCFMPVQDVPVLLAWTKCLQHSLMSLGGPHMPTYIWRHILILHTSSMKMQAAHTSHQQHDPLPQGKKILKTGLTLWEY